MIVPGKALRNTPARIPSGRPTMEKTKMRKTAGLAA
jgi:hypothetical protein